MARRALIIGGSLGGLFAAGMLRTQGWDVQVYERVRGDLAGRGAGIGTNQELVDVMRRMGIEVDDSVGVRAASRICLDRSGSVVHEISVPRIISSWGMLYRLVRQALPSSCYSNKTLTTLRQSGAAVIAVFSDGAEVEGDLLVGADGLRSVVRAELMPDAVPRYAGYVAWRGVVPEASMPEDLHRQIFENNAIGLPEGEMMTAFPIPGAQDDLRPGHRAYNFVWYHPVRAEALEDMMTDVHGVHHPLGIPPPLIRREVVAGIRAVARDVLAPQFRAIVELATQPFFQAIYDVEVPAMVRGRVALLGDAAFVARPHVGMGVTKAALDAECLADSLAALGQDIPAALEDYSSRQGLFGRRVVARARRLGAHLEAQLSKPRELRTAEELRQDPAIVTREIGIRLCDIPELHELVQASHRSVAQPARRT